MFFARCVVYLVGLLPQEGRFWREVRLMSGYYDCEEKVVEWHRVELERLDSRFRYQQECLRQIDWKEEARVHADVLDRYRKTGPERMRRLEEAIREYPQERVDAVTQACVSALKRKDH